MVAFIMFLMLRLIKFVIDKDTRNNSNLGPILHHFGDYDSFYVLLAPPLFYRNFGVFPSHQIAHVGVSQRISLNLFGHERIPNPIYVSTVPVGLPEVRHRQTDATLSQYRTVHNIVREKNHYTMNLNS